MAAYDLEEQEQLEELKTWWKQHGNRVSSVLTVVALAAAGWQGWQWYQKNQSAQAAVVYSALQQATQQHDAKRSKELAGELIDKYPGSVYAAMGVLVSARQQVEAGDSKSARAQLSWAAESAADDALRDLARLRLAILSLDEKAYDEAARLLAKDPAHGFLARYGEVRGDLLMAQGKTAEARAAYEAAIKQADENRKAISAGEDAAGKSQYADMLRSKLDAVGGAK